MIKQIRAFIHFNSSRYRIDQEVLQFSRGIKSGALVLDAGAGIAPYRQLFSHTNYETADFEQVQKQYTPSTYVCDLKSIPVENERYDYILFNQVMEHLPEPQRVLLELNRILKKNGTLLYTCLLYTSPSPRDRTRSRMPSSA